ncbi:MAG TPA: alpha/beta hydrolase-fold protein [Spirochaetota bacterium]
MKQICLSMSLVLFAAAFISMTPLSAADQSQSSAHYQGIIPSGGWLKNLTVPYSGDEGSFSVAVQIYFPEGYKAGDAVRTLILLPSWGRNQTEWEKSSNVKRYANERKYILVCPDMGKTVYENDYYPETTVKWHELPGGKWIIKALVPWLRDEFSLCRSRELTGITGVGFGARGAILSAARYPEVFGFAGGISGTYDAESVPLSTPFVGVYGKYKENKERWASADNVIALVPNLKDTIVFMAHGKRERGSPIELSQIVLIKLAQLKKQNPGKFPYKFVVQEWGDEWEVWNKFLSDMFIQFDTPFPVK